MTEKDVVLAIDTSNYTTSVSIMSMSGELVANLKEPLVVKPGERGLRQSDAVFAHTVNLPKLMARAGELLADKNIVAVGVSDKPRNVRGSYMPCFLAGVSMAVGIATALGVPLYRFSHQCGHIMAAVYSSGREELLSSEFAAFHVSGGTTELVRVTPLQHGFETQLVGGTRDLNAGQVIDRVGVYMGIGFPAGASMEREALKNARAIQRKKISADGLFVNLSGLENMATKLYDESGDVSYVSAFVFDYVGRAISYLSEGYEEIYGKARFVYAGGVMCNSLIKNMLSERYDASFAEPSMSADNAVGIAALARRAYNSERR